MRWFILALALFSGAGAAAQPVEHFARLPMFKNVTIAPDGGGFIATIENSGRYEASIFRLRDGDIAKTYAAREDDKRYVRVFEWAADDRVVLSVGFAAKRFGTDTIETRLFSVDAQGGEPLRLFRYDRREPPVQLEDAVVSWLHHDPDHILVQYRSSVHARWPSVYKTSIRKRSRHKTVQRQKPGIVNWSADMLGNVRSGWGYSDEMETQQYLIVRLPDSEQWIDLSSRLEDGKPAFGIMGFSEDPNVMYVESAHEFDPPAIYEFDIANQSFGDVIFRHETVDANSLLLEPGTGRLRGVTFIEDEVKTIWLAPEIERETSQIADLFPDHSVSLISESESGDHAVYSVTSGTFPGQYYIYTRAEKTLFGLPHQYPELAGAALSDIAAVRYDARDSLEIPAYITLPQGVDSLNDLASAPFVIMPHGGPTLRDFIAFDYWTQFLASRGYAVFQMNYRGSAGYGAEFHSAGHRQWGQAMQDDITDGVQWLIENGYADEDRIAIMGGSYGGYAALMGSVKTPDLYQCVVSFAGVSDLPDFIASKRYYVGGRGWTTSHIGRLWTDRRMLADNSPARRADDVKIPVLLAHGEDDRIVDVTQSRKMARALRRADKPVTFIELDKGDHYLSLYANRLRFLQETESFLGGCLGRG